MQIVLRSKIKCMREKSIVKRETEKKGLRGEIQGTKAKEEN